MLIDGFAYCDGCGVKVAWTDEDALLDTLMKKDKLKKFRFLEHQLGVLDKKASAIVSLDGLLLALTASLTATRTAINSIARLILSMSSILVLFSAAMSAYILATKWATSEMSKSHNIHQGFNRLMVLRDEKTHFLHCSLFLLFMALLGYALSVTFYLLI